jgi:hypothetical protein
MCIPRRGLEHSSRLHNIAGLGLECLVRQETDRCQGRRSDTIPTHLHRSASSFSSSGRSIVGLGSLEVHFGI